jgi:putative transposase
VCRVLGVPRSTHYYRSTEHDDEAVKRAIEGVLGDWPTYGYRRVTHQLRRQGLRVNSKRIRRLMKEMGVAGKVVCRKRRTTNSEHSFPRYPNLVQELAIERPDQVWVADITYVRLVQEFVFLAVIMDVFTRSVRGWHLWRNLDQELTLTALRSALAQRTPEIHHSDQGVQYAAKDYVQMLKDAGADISMAAVGEPTENGFAERLMRTIKEEEVDLSDYENYHDAYAQMGRFLDEVYMLKRIHSSLGYLTPVEFEAQWRSHQAAAEGVV